MTGRNETKIINFGKGMFQYFIFFHSNEENEPQTQPFTFGIHSHRNNINFTCPKMNLDMKSNRKVQFIDKPNIKILHTWQFAYMQARRDKWQQAARDRTRFEMRIKKLSEIISPILEKKYEDITENLRKWG